MSGATVRSSSGAKRDLPWAWVVALASSWIAFCNTGIYRSSGVLYVQMVHVFGASRELASWPFSLFGAVSSFAGILPGLLVRWMTVRQLVLLGSAISVIGVAGCAVADSVFWIALSFGIISGFGSGLMMTLLPVILNQYFVVNRATASGILLSGSTLSLLVLPSLTQLLLDTYTLHGTFLILAGVVMNIFVGALLLRPLPKDTGIRLLPTRNDQTETEWNSFEKKQTACGPSCGAGSTAVALIKECAEVLSNPMFLMITFCSVTSRNVLVMFSLVLVDYVLDKELTESQGVFLISVVALPELLGRLCSGWISDHGYVKRKHVFLAAQVVSGAMLSLLTLAKTSWILFLFGACFALVNGGGFILINVFYLEYLGIDRLPVALSLKNIFMGLSSLLRPTIIGIFRDRIHSYDYLFHSFAIISAVSGVIWWLEPVLLKKQKKRTDPDSDTPAL